MRSQEYTVREFSIGARVHIRALEVVNDSTVWFGANRGVWGFTTDGGKKWHIDSLNVGGYSPQFRSIAVLNDSSALLLGIDSPAFLFKTADRGEHWSTVYRDDRKGIFFDCMVFENKKSGVALADPIDSCFQLISTVDGGDTWQRLSCEKVPKAVRGEACFAASNSNLFMKGGSTWFVTGGKRSRVFYSPKKDRSFKTTLCPLPQGETMTGAYSIDFFDKRHGAVAGGNYERTDSSIASLAITNDAGITWKTIRTGRSFFGSCVRFITRDKLIVTGHDGSFLVNTMNGKVIEIKSRDGSALKYYTVRLTPDKKYAWMAGANGKLARVPLKN